MPRTPEAIDRDKATEQCNTCSHQIGYHLRTGCAVDSDEAWACTCPHPGNGPRQADGSWPTWVNPEARHAPHP